MNLVKLSFQSMIILLALTGAFARGAESDIKEAPVVPLNGVILRQALKNFAPEGVEISGLDLQASTVVSADPIFRSKVEAMLGQPITLSLLQKIAGEVVLAYRRVGRTLADAAVPEQKISNGTVQVIVLEAHLGAVHVEGAKYFSPERMKTTLRTLPGEPLVAGTLFSDLDWLNQNSFRRVDLVYERGQDLSTTDVTLRVTEQQPWQAFVGYDNENVEALGRDRWFAGVRAGNLWGREHLGSLLYTQARDASVYQGVALDYTVPLARTRQLLTLLASYAEPAVSDTTFDSIGKSWRLGLRYGGEFSRTRLWQLNWTAGYDAKSNNSDILFGGTTVYSGAYQTHEFVGELSARRPGPAGETTLKATWYYSPGNIGTKNSSADLSDSGRTEIDSQYAYGDFTAGHKFSLPLEFTLGLAGSLRLTNDRLPPSSEFSLGGVAQLPGYTEATALGDTATWAQVRLQSPVFHVLQKIALASSDAIRFSAFYSIGQASINDLTEVEASQGLREQRKLESIGLGATYEYSRHLQVNFVYGWQLRSPATKVERASRGHISAVLNF